MPLIGLWVSLGRRGSDAAWMTASTPSRAESSPVPEAISPTAYSTPSDAARARRLRTRTAWPATAAVRTKARPGSPVPPVMSILIAYLPHTDSASDFEGDRALERLAHERARRGGEQEVARRAGNAPFELPDAPRRPRLPRDPGRALHARPFVSGERRFDLGGPAQTPRERVRTLDGHARALPHVRRRRVRGVAEEHDAPRVPAPHRVD